MNTLIYLWIEPLAMNHQRCDSDKKVYFNCIVKGDLIADGEIDIDTLDNALDGEIMDDIMEFADIQQNWNYRSVSAKLTNKPIGIEFAESPEDIRINKGITAIVKSKKDIPLTAKNVEVNDGGKIDVMLPALNIKETIDFAKLWSSIEKNFIGKIKEGDNVIFTDDKGNKIFELTGGSFLNIGVADLSVYSPNMPQDPTMMDKIEHLIGGLFIRDNGDIEIGDRDRTFYMRINTNKLLKTSLRLKKSLMELTQQKLLK